MGKVFVGMSTTRREGSDAQAVSVVQVGDIDDRTGAVRPMRDLNLVPLSDKAGVDRYLVRTGDVVVSCKGTLLKTGFIDEATAGGLATSNLVVVRSKGAVPAKTLFFVLRSEGAKRVLRGLQKVGPTIASLSYRDIQTLKFRVPSLECQAQIVEVLDAHREYTELSLKAIQIREELVSGLVDLALWGGMPQRSKR